MSLCNYFWKDNELCLQLDEVSVYLMLILNKVDTSDTSERIINIKNTFKSLYEKGDDLISNLDPFCQYVYNNIDLLDIYDYVDKDTCKCMKGFTIDYTCDPVIKHSHFDLNDIKVRRLLMWSWNGNLCGYLCPNCYLHRVYYPEWIDPEEYEINHRNLLCNEFKSFTNVNLSLININREIATLRKNINHVNDLIKCHNDKHIHHNNLHIILFIILIAIVIIAKL